MIKTNLKKKLKYKVDQSNKDTFRSTAVWCYIENITYTEDQIATQFFNSSI